MKQVLYACGLCAAVGLLFVLLSVLRKRDFFTKKSSGKIPVDYRTYLLSRTEYITWGSVFLGGTGLGAYLMFHNVMSGIILGLLLLVPFYKRLARNFCRRRIGRLESQFCVYLQLMAASLAGGTPLEKVFRDVLTSIPFGISQKDNLISAEFLYIDNLISFRYDPVEAFARFAERSGSGDIQCMSAALSAVFSSGGNLAELVRNAASALRSKQDTEKEIAHIVSLPRMNHRIMTCMPFAFLITLRWLSPGYIDYLYAGAGVVAMAVVSAFIAGAWILGEKLGEIKF